MKGMEKEEGKRQTEENKIQDEGRRSKWGEQEQKNDKVEMEEKCNMKVQGVNQMQEIKGVKLRNTERRSRVKCLKRKTRNGEDLEKK